MEDDMEQLTGWVCQGDFYVSPISGNLAGWVFKILIRINKNKLFLKNDFKKLINEIIKMHAQ